MIPPFQDLNYWCSYESPSKSQFGKLTVISDGFITWLIITM